MNVTEAAKVWEKSKRDIDRIKPQMEAAAAVLKEHFHKTGKADYKGVIGFAVTTRVQLDSEKVKSFLGKRLEKFQKRVTYETLSLLR